MSIAIAFISRRAGHWLKKLIFCGSNDSSRKNKIICSCVLHHDRESLSYGDSVLEKQQGPISDLETRRRLKIQG